MENLIIKQIFPSCIEFLGATEAIDEFFKFKRNVLANHSDSLEVDDIVENIKELLVSGYEDLFKISLDYLKIHKEELGPIGLTIDEDLFWIMLGVARNLISYNIDFNLLKDFNDALYRECKSKGKLIDFKFKFQHYQNNKEIIINKNEHRISKFDKEDLVLELMSEQYHISSKVKLIDNNIHKIKSAIRFDLEEKSPIKITEYIEYEPQMVDNIDNEQVIVYMFILNALISIFIISNFLILPMYSNNLKLDHQLRFTLNLLDYNKEFGYFEEDIDGSRRYNFNQIDHMRKKGNKENNKNSNSNNENNKLEAPIDNQNDIPIDFEDLSCIIKLPYSPDLNPKRIFKLEETLNLFLEVFSQIINSRNQNEQIKPGLIGFPDVLIEYDS
ncbi:MAG: hypothetical protein ACTSVC_17235 [Promethearchaeota archaeon]